MARGHGIHTIARSSRLLPALREFIQQRWRAVAPVTTQLRRKDAARNVNSKVMPEDVATVSRRLGVDLNDSVNHAGMRSRIRDLISSVSGKGQKVYSARGTFYNSWTHPHPHRFDRDA